MTLEEFINKWLGKKADFDGYYGGQCVDLYRFYVQEVLGFPQSPGVGGAAEIWHSASPEYYDFIENTPTAVPQAGDIVIWNRNTGGGFGHVAIFLHGDVNSFTSLDQNWPTLDVVTKTKHNYTNIIGWLRPKESKMPSDRCLVPNTPEWKAKFDELVTKATIYDNMVSAGFQSVEAVRNKLADLENAIKGRDETLKSLNQLINDKNGVISRQETSISTLEEKVLQNESRIESLTEQAKKSIQLEKERDELLDQRARWQESEKTFNRTIGQLKAENEALRDGAIKALLMAIWDKVKELIGRLKIK